MTDLREVLRKAVDAGYEAELVSYATRYLNGEFGLETYRHFVGQAVQNVKDRLGFDPWGGKNH